MSSRATNPGGTPNSSGRWQHELELAKRLAFAAGTVLRSYQVNAVEVKSKAGGEVVTAADIQSDSIIRDGLKTAFPGDAIFSEETPDSPERFSSARVWIVDPLDSTSDFLAKGDQYSVSIGLCIEHRAVLGVVYNPVRNQLFAGSIGQGVTLDGMPVRVSQATGLEKARITVSAKEWRRGLDKLAAKIPLQPLASMAYKLARVAAGLDDAVFSAMPRKEWGTCAGVALVHAAGGQASLLDGSDILFNRQERRQPMGMLAAGPNLYPILLHALQTNLPGWRAASAP